MQTPGGCAFEFKNSANHVRAFVDDPAAQLRILAGALKLGCELPALMTCWAARPLCPPHDLAASPHKLAATSSPCMQLLGETNLLAERSQPAVAAYKRAVQLRDNDMQIATGLTDAYIANGQQVRARGADALNRVCMRGRAWLTPSPCQARNVGKARLSVPNHQCASTEIARDLPVRAKPSMWEHRHFKRFACTCQIITVQAQKLQEMCLHVPNHHCASTGSTRDVPVFAESYLCTSACMPAGRHMLFLEAP